MVSLQELLFESTDEHQIAYAGPLLFGEKLLGILYVDGLPQVFDEYQRILQVLGSLIVTYMEMGNVLALEIEKRILESSRRNRRTFITS